MGPAGLRVTIGRAEGTMTMHMLRLRARHLVALVALSGAGFVLAASTSTAATTLPRLPTQLTGRQALEVRPAVVSVTGDGTAFLGGFTGRSSVRMPSREKLAWAGRLRWSSWTRARARATGAIWLNNGTPNDAQGTFHPSTVTLQVSRPSRNVFTRLTYTYTYQGMTQVTRLKAAYSPPQNYNGVHVPGFWQWEVAG